jgi:hypothetical protein
MPRYLLSELARIVRSKNAGPFVLTIDVVLPSRECLYEVSRQLTRDAIARAYGVKPEDVLGIVVYEPAVAIKINLRRRVAAGEPGDTDVYGAQQHVPLLQLEVEVERCGPSHERRS